MEVKGTSKSVGSVSAHSITLHTVMPSKNTAKGRASISKRYTFQGRCKLCPPPYFASGNVQIWPVIGKQTFYVLGCAAQKENLMADDFSASTNGSGMTFIIKPLFKKSSFANLTNIRSVCFFGKMNLKLITWMMEEIYPCLPNLVQIENELCAQPKGFGLEQVLGEVFLAGRRCSDNCIKQH